MDLKTTVFHEAHSEDFVILECTFLQSVDR